MSGATDVDRPPTALAVIADSQVDHIVVTGALREGHWLQHCEACGTFTVLFVAEDLEAEARRVWPDIACREASGVRG